MLRSLTILATLSLAALPQAGAETAAVRYIGPSVDGAYSSTRGTTPEACEAQCQADQRCVSWTLTKPTFRTGPRCLLSMTDAPAQTRQAAPPRQSTPLPTSPTATAKPAADLRGRAPSPSTTPSTKPATRPVASPAAISASKPPAPVPAKTTTRSSSQAPTVTRRVVSTRTVPAPPPMIARPQTTPVSATPVAPQTAPVSQAGPSTPTSEPAGASLAADGLKPLPGAPRVATGTDDRPPLPRRRLDDAPSYSVQSMDILPGDYEATAGYLDAFSESEDPETEPASEPAGS